MLVTKIEDRFGNVQQFIYDGDRLVSVVNPKEMQLDLRYRTDVPTLVDQVILRPYTATPRTWTYQYADLGTGHETLHWRYATRWHGMGLQPANVGPGHVELQRHDHV